MSLPIVNFDPLLTAPSVRGLTWSLKKTEQWKTVRQQADAGRTVKLPRWNNPLFGFELKWDYVNDNWPGSIQLPQLANAPFSDFQVLRSLYFTGKGSGNEFLYQPLDSIVTNQFIPQPDANNNSEVVKTYGGYPVQFATTNLTVTNVAIAGNILTVTVSAIDVLAPEMAVTFSGVGTASFLNGQTVIVTTVNAGANKFTAFFSHANYGPASDSGTAAVTWPTQAVHESVQVLQGNGLTALNVNGVAQTSPTNFLLAGPSSVAPYDGYVIQWQVGSVPAAGALIQASYSYYYQSEWTDDSLEYENFLPYLWKVGSLKFDQVRL